MKGHCMNCKKKQPTLVRWCKKCIELDVKRLNKKRAKKGLLPYEIKKTSHLGGFFISQYLRIVY